MAPKKRISKRSDQYFDINTKNLLDSLGDADLGELSGIDPEVAQAYKIRRLRLAELEANLKKLLNTTKVDKDLRKKVSTLAREIKAVALTDPTETFKFDSSKFKNNNFKKNLKIGNQNFGGWLQTTADWYKKGKPPNFEAHHKGGLDVTFKGILGKSDSELIDLHASLAAKGKGLGNNPLNRIFLRKGSHQSSPRRGGAESQAVHPLLDLTEPGSNDFMKLLDETVDQRVTTDWGLAEGRKILPPLEEPGDFGWNFEQFENLLDHEYSIADSIPSQIGPEEQYWTRELAGQIGDAKTRILKTFVNRYPDPNAWPEGTRELLKTGDTEGIMRLTDELDLSRRSRFDKALQSTFSDSPIGRIFKKGSKIYNEIPGAVKVGGGALTALGMADLVLGPLDIHAGGRKVVEAEKRESIDPGDKTRAQYAASSGRLQQLSGGSGTVAASTVFIPGAQPVAGATGLYSLFTQLAAWRMDHLSKNYRSPLEKLFPSKFDINKQNLPPAFGEYDEEGKYSVQIRKTEPSVPNLTYIK